MSEFILLSQISWKLLLGCPGSSFWKRIRPIAKVAFHNSSRKVAFCYYTSHAVLGVTSLMISGIVQIWPCFNKNLKPTYLLLSKICLHSGFAPSLSSLNLRLKMFIFILPCFSIISCVYACLSYVKQIELLFEFAIQYKYICLDLLFIMYWSFYCFKFVVTF